MRTSTSLSALSSFRPARVRICGSLFAPRLLFFVLALWACCSSALAASNYVAQPPVFLGAPPALGPAGQFGPLSGDSGCLTTNTIASGFALVQCRTNGGTWQTAPLITPNGYDTLPNSAWIGCPGLSSN